MLPRDLESSASVAENFRPHFGMSEKIKEYLLWRGMKGDEKSLSSSFMLKFIDQLLWRGTKSEEVTLEEMGGGGAKGRVHSVPHKGSN